MSSDKIIVMVDADLEELIPGFLEKRQADIAHLNAAADSLDFAALQFIGHNLKGIGGGYGFDEVSEMGAAIESAAMAQDINTAARIIARLDAYLQNVDVAYE